MVYESIHQFPERRSVVVTGGRSGIGQAIAEAFRVNGDRVAVLDLTDGGDVIRVDVADEASVRAAPTPATSCHNMEISDR